MLHRDSTDMGDHPWMQQEELSFLSNPAACFNERHDEALRLIGDRVGLDCFGIDCGLDRGGNLVVFEVNASMLVHNDNGVFAYRDSFVGRIKVAFNQLLKGLADRGSAINVRTAARSGPGRSPASDIGAC